MALRNYTTHALELCAVPPWRAEHVAMMMDQPSTYFEGWQGNSVFVPSEALPGMERDEYRKVAGTRIDGYSPNLDVLLWQFGRNWMGHPGENYTLLAAPEEDVFDVLDGTLSLVGSFDEMGRRLPDDCNVHWRSFPEHQRQAFESLLRFLKHTEIVVPEDVPNPARSFLKKYARPTAHAQSPTGQYGRGDCLLKIEQQADKSLIIRLATVFSVFYGIDQDEDE